MSSLDSKLDTAIRRLFWSGEQRDERLRRQQRFLGGQDLKVAQPKGFDLPQAS